MPCTFWAAHFVGRALSVKTVASLTAYAGIFVLMSYFGVDYIWVYRALGCFGLVATLLLYVKFSRFSDVSTQHKHLLMRRRYSLYYVLVFLSGARRQRFMVFAGFMMVEKFGYSLAEISAY